MADLETAPRDLRPSPEALLAAAAREARGKLKIFLGAAPGVGKTYEMLAAARRRKAEGVDVVGGLVETHGRAETEAQMVGLEVVPRRKVEYKGRTIDEMDIDAILKRFRNPAIRHALAQIAWDGSQKLPFRLLAALMNVEELLTLWRYRHALMVQRMIGVKIGTGNCSAWRNPAGSRRPAAVPTWTRGGQS